MRIVAGGASLAIHVSHRLIPKTARAPMRTRFPVAISRPVATAAKWSAVRDFQFIALARSQSVELVFVVTIEAVVVAAMRSVSHNDVFVFFGNDDDALLIETDWRRFIFFMAAITIVFGNIHAAGEKFLRRNARRRRADEISVRRRNGMQNRRPRPQVQNKGNGEKGEANGDHIQHPFGLAGFHMQ